MVQSESLRSVAGIQVRVVPNRQAIAPDPPKQEKRKRVGPRKVSSTERKIALALDQLTSLEFTDNTLKDVVGFIHRQHNIPIRLDERGSAHDRWRT